MISADEGAGRIVSGSALLSGGGVAGGDFGGGVGDGEGEAPDVGIDIGIRDGIDARRCWLVRLGFRRGGTAFEPGLDLKEPRSSWGTLSTISISSSSSASCTPASSRLRFRRRRFVCGLEGVIGWRFSFRRREAGVDGDWLLSSSKFVVA
jgi:hypothetical protein